MIRQFAAGQGVNSIDFVPGYDELRVPRGMENPSEQRRAALTRALRASTGRDDFLQLADMLGLHPDELRDPT